MRPNILTETDEERRKRVDETLNRMSAGNVAFSRDSNRIREGMYASGRTPEQQRERMMRDQLDARQSLADTEASAATEQERLRAEGLKGVAEIQGTSGTEQERIRQEGLLNVEQSKPRPFQILTEGAMAVDQVTGEVRAENARSPAPAKTNVATPVVDDAGNQVPGKFMLNGEVITVQQQSDGPFDQPGGESAETITTKSNELPVIPPEQVANLPKGTRFKTTDGRIMVKR